MMILRSIANELCGLQRDQGVRARSRVVSRVAGRRKVSGTNYRRLGDSEPTLVGNLKVSETQGKRGGGRESVAGGGKAWRGEGKRGGGREMEVHGGGHESAV